MAESKVKKIAEDVTKGRKAQLDVNRTNENDPYNETHPDVISDGDNYGKNEQGSKDDITARSKGIDVNTYNANNVYSVDD